MGCRLVQVWEGQWQCRFAAMGQRELILGLKGVG